MRGEPAGGGEQGVREGDVLGGFRLEQLIGEGAMGRVFRAKHLLLGHEVAIKVLNELLLGDDMKARFIREAKATMCLRSEHAVRVFELGVAPNGVPYMVLELLVGTDLRAELRARGALPVSEAVDYVLQVCEGLADAHAKGIVHRDLKPQNMFVTRRPNGAPCVKLLDFGISKLQVLDAGAEELTSSQMLLGSPVYVSPEQIRNPRKIDARADIWSLGVVLYLLVSGARPFDGEGAASLCAAIVADPPSPLSDRFAGVPRALEEVIFACLEKARDRRPQSVVELARKLAPFASPLGRVSVDRLAQLLVAPTLLASSPPDPLSASTRRPLATLPTMAETPAPLAESKPRAPRRLALPLVLAALAALAVSVVAWAYTRPRAAVPAEDVVAAAPAMTGGTTAAATSTEAAASPTTEHVAAPVTQPRAAAIAAPPRVQVAARPAPLAPTSTTKPKRLDRNGVPILD